MNWVGADGPENPADNGATRRMITILLAEAS